MKRSFFQRYALLILLVTLLVAPFALFGSRMAISGMRNDVKDWLPDDFDETTELEWFRDRFTTEAFVVASWDGCQGTNDDQPFHRFLDRFFPETPPSQRLDSNAANAPPEELGQPTEAASQLDGRQFEVDSSPARQQWIGNRLGLYQARDEHFDWSNQKEKWLRGEDQWYFILPTGDLYRWDDADTLPGRIARGVRALFTGNDSINATKVASLGEIDGPWYYEDPGRLDADLFQTVVSGPSVLEHLTRAGGELEGDREAALDRLEGLLFGPDRQQTCFLITLTALGRDHPHRVVGLGMPGRPRGKLLDMAEQAGLSTPGPPSLLPPPLDRWGPQAKPMEGPVFRMAGSAVDNVAIDEAGQETMVRLVGISGLTGLLIAWLSFRRIRVTLLLFLVGGSGAVASMAVVWWVGASMDAVLMSMPSLVYLLGLSGAVHIVNYYRDTLEDPESPGDPGAALRLGWKPCSLAAFTTALGLVSLCTSNIVPIQKFGFFSAVGVLLSLWLVCFFLPAGLNYWPPSRRQRNVEEAKGAQRLSLIAHRWGSFIGEFIIRRHRLVAIVCVLVFLGCVAGLPQINTSVQLMKLFQAESKIIQDYTWLETHLGKVVPMELVVRVDADAVADIESGDVAAGNADADTKFGLSFLERLEIVEHIRAAVDAKFGKDGDDLVGQSISAASLVRPLPASGGSGRLAVRSAFSRRLSTHRDELLESDYLRIDETDQAELWRLSLRVGALDVENYGTFIHELKETVQPLIEAYRSRDSILRAIDTNNAKSGFRGASVLLLGVPAGASQFAKVPRQPEQQSDEAVAQDSAERAALAIFTRTLHTLLRNAGLSVRDWHDPRYELPDDWERKLEEFDCVVVAKRDPRYDALEERPDTPVHYVDQTAVAPGADGVAVDQMTPPPVSVVYTGLVPVLHKAQRTLLRSLIESTGWAFCAISLVMILVLRDPVAGMASMIPNVFPVVLIFGGMGWLGVLVDIGTMMTASVAIGVAVDDTVHFLTWFRTGLDRGLDRESSIRLAYDKCAIAMIQTTLIGGLGLSVYALSTFVPTHRFGVLMLTLLSAALVGDLVFLPAILAGPFGQVFERKRRNPAASG